MQMKKDEISDKEDAIERLDAHLRDLSAKLCTEKERGVHLKQEYGQIMTALLQTEIENKKLKQGNDQQENLIETEIAALR